MKLGSGAHLHLSPPLTAWGLNENLSTTASLAHAQVEVVEAVEAGSRPAIALLARDSGGGAERYITESERYITEAERYITAVRDAIPMEHNPVDNSPP